MTFITLLFITGMKRDESTGMEKEASGPHRSAAYRARSATGQNGEAAKEKMSWKARCRENTSSFQLMEKRFSLDIPFL